MQSIIRVVKNDNFVVMDKTFLKNKNLSWKAKGILAFMLSKPDDWEFHINELIGHSTDGEASFRAGFKELKDNGYVQRYPIREGNRIARWETVVVENPLLCDFQQVENLHLENLHVENQALLNNDNTKNDSTKNDYKDIVDYLNEKTGRKYRHTTRKTQSLIKARINEGFTVDDFKKVIDIKTAEWLNDPRMSKYLRPETLFGTKFESYLNQPIKREPIDFEERLMQKEKENFDRKIKLQRWVEAGNDPSEFVYRGLGS